MKACIVGAGPVGCLAALSLAKEGWQVNMYERRPDPRHTSERGPQRSVNVVISSRAIAALDSVNPALKARLLNLSMPLKGRMIHSTQGAERRYLYDDKDNQCIYSINRPLLNQWFVSEVVHAIEEGYPICLLFEHKMEYADFDEKVLAVSTPSGLIHVGFDLCVGADGCYSPVRRQIMRVVQMEYEQTFISHHYIELRIPAGAAPDGSPKYLLDPNHLHVWPRHSFMLVAFPNKDMSFTCSIFAPASDLAASLQTRQTSLDFFSQHFSDVVPLLGEKDLLDALENNPRNSLANPYHYKGRAVILGDAAHTMVPFIGQGLNAGLEDVRVLTTLLREKGITPKSCIPEWTLEEALWKYSEMRHADSVAISDLAMQNYVEMRHSVTTRAYLIRKVIDAVLTVNVPFSQLSSELASSKTPFPSSMHNGWIPLYTMISFRADIPYAVAKAKAEYQTRIVNTVGQAVVGTAVAALAFAGFMVWRGRA